MGDYSYLLDLMSEKRYQHCVRVAQMAARLAAQWQADPALATCAGMLHDCAKQLTPEILTKRGIIQPTWSDRVYAHYGAVWHALVGPIVAKHYWKIPHPSVLGAMKWHATGRPGMRLLEKIIYVADFIEDQRPWSYRQALEALAFSHLDQAVFAIVYLKMYFLLQHGQKIYPDTFRCYNALVTAKTPINQEKLRQWLSQ